MGNNGFFGNWAKYSMEKREMNLENKIDWAIHHPELYQKEQLLALLRETKQYYIDKAVPADPIYDESGFQIGSAAPLEKKVERLDYYTCRATSLSDLEQQVNKLVKVGYKPQGGIAVMNDTMYQAVFLDLPKETVVAPTYDKKYMHF